MAKQNKYIIKICSFIGLAVMITILFYSPDRTYASSSNGKSIIVTFDANDGSSDVYDMVAFYGDSYGPLPEATRTNYDFLGWYTYRSGGMKVTETTKVVKPLDHTLYARWGGIETEITLETDGGALRSNTVKVYYGTKFYNQLPTPVKENYRFAGWYTALTGGERITTKTIFTEKSPTTLYARWTEKTVKVIFIAFNGEAYEMEVINGSTFGELPEPEKENYSFGGWYKYKDYTNRSAEPITADTIVKEVGQIKLYARWYLEGSTIN
jgi:uncharacterized repeat protein (TIGR02543 family)